MTDQSDSELRAFRAFVDAAKLRVIPHSVETRHPPEPDVLCRLEDGEQVAFELVEVCNPVNARFLQSSHRIHRLIMSAYRALPSHVRESFDTRFVEVPLSFCFQQGASLARIKTILPRLLTELVSAPEQDWEYRHFSQSVASTVIKVAQRGKLNNPGEVNFNLGGQYDPSVPLDAVAAKLTKAYEARCPIELVAHFGPYAWSRDPSYRDSLV